MRRADRRRCDGGRRRPRAPATSEAVGRRRTARAAVAIFNAQAEAELAATTTLKGVVAHTETVTEMNLGNGKKITGRTDGLFFAEKDDDD